ncbi:MAG: DUF4112 domain-containing protein [Cytophagaceae bacterium]|nr:DUF4112 domain-containing protein [Cytophagaceae bacterium]
MEITDPKDIKELQWAENLARLLDSKFTFPGTNFKFGIDPLIGLIPGLGDLTTFSISAVLLYTLTKHGSSRKVVILMTLNVLADTVIGGIPVIGNIFDFFYKANDKNIRLLKSHYHEGKHQGSGNGILLAILFFFFAMICLVFYGMFKLFQYLINLL